MKIVLSDKFCNSKGFPEIKPIIIGIWCGVGKPTSIIDYLAPFIAEMNAIARDGVLINGYRLDVDIRCFICDSPARSFVKGLFFFIFYKNINFSVALLI